MKHLNQIANNFKYDNIFAHIDSICKDANHCLYIRNLPGAEPPENRNLFNYVLNELDTSLLSIFKSLHFYHFYENKELTKNMCRTIYLIKWLHDSLHFAQQRYNTKVSLANKLSNIFNGTNISSDINQHLIDWDNLTEILNRNMDNEFTSSFKKFNKLIINDDIAIDQFLIDNFKNFSFNSFLNYQNFINRFGLSEEIIKNNSSNDYYLIQMLTQTNGVLDIFISLFQRFKQRILNDNDLLKEFLMLIPVTYFKSNEIDIDYILNEHQNFNDDYEFVEAFRELNKPVFSIN